MTKPRSLKKGESPTWEVGRKATGLKKNNRDRGGKNDKNKRIYGKI